MNLVIYFSKTHFWYLSIAVYNVTMFMFSHNINCLDIMWAYRCEANKGLRRRFTIYSLIKYNLWRNMEPKLYYSWFINIYYNFLNSSLIILNTFDLFNLLLSRLNQLKTHNEFYGNATWILCIDCNRFCANITLFGNVLENGLQDDR